MSNRQPNVLWIFCDQLRAQAIACNGDTNLRTPNIDRIAREGVNFSCGVSQYPVCSPFRAGLVTGQFAHVNGLRVHGDMLPPDRKTIAHAFRAAGYRTSWFGKWHLASVQGVTGWKEGADFWVHPLLRGGFEDWAGWDSSNHYYNTRYSIGNQIWPPKKLEGYQTDALADLSLAYLQTRTLEDRPWFHCVSFESPHPGCDQSGTYGHCAPEEYARRFDPAKLVLRGNVPAPSEAEARRRLAGYYAQIENLDHNVGRLLQWLDDSGEAQRTLVVFFSDHGEMGGSHGRFEKEEIFEESIQIPILMRLPGRIPAGRLWDKPFSGVDLFPTTAALCDVPVPAEVQGMDLSGAARGLESPVRTEALVQWMGPALQGFGDFAYRGIRTQRYTYAVSDAPARCVLFDNQQDPWQLQNLFANAAALKTELHARLCRAIVESGEALPAFIGARA